MTVCLYFLQGRCKFGNSCKNEHPQTRPGSGNVAGAAYTVPFSQDGMAKDLTPNNEKPIWPMSSFGPAKYEPTIIAGLDISPEELRFKAIQALNSGNAAEYQKFELEKMQEADQTYVKALGEINLLFKHAHDLSLAHQRNLPPPMDPVYNSPTNAASPAFRAPNFGNTGPVVSAFGKPAFGQPAFGQPSFGQSAFGQAAKPVSAFGQPGPTVSAFGGQVNQTSAFGQPAQTSAFGQTSQPQSSFIRPASGAFSAFAGNSNSPFMAAAQQNNATPAFGQTTAFGANANNSPSVLNQPPTQPSAFGLPPKPVSAFGQPSAFGQQNQSAFEQPTQMVSAFGQPINTTSAFGQPSQPVSAFAQPSQLVSAFSQNVPIVSAFAQTPPNVSAFVNGGHGFAGLPPKPQARTPDFASALAEIKAVPMLDKHDGLLPEDYASQLPADVKEAFAAPRFEWGKIPEWIPPIEMR